MQILGKRSKILLIAVAIVMLVAVGVSFAMWDSSGVKATNGDMSSYANAKVGETVFFGNYYQTGEKVSAAEDAEYKKTPIEWIVVDKDERTGQLTLMSKYILAAGSYFANWYYSDTSSGYLYDQECLEVGKIPYNQAYVESTARAFLNNLERRDLGGDSYIDGAYKTSAVSSNATTGKLLTSVGFSNRKYNISDSEYYRPITSKEYRERPATRGFYDEAFSNTEKTMIVPKVIAGYTGFRWPNQSHEISDKTFIEGTLDKVWLPSATELNIMAVEDNYTNPSDEASSTVFEYFKNYTQYKNPITDKGNKSLAEALATIRTQFVKNNSKAMNYSIPVYKYQSTDINDGIHEKSNSSDHYWTRSPVSSNYYHVRLIHSSGSFGNYSVHYSYFGVRPCLILKY